MLRSRFFISLMMLGGYFLYDFTWGESAVTYQQPIATVRARLATVEQPPLVLGSEYKEFKLGPGDSQSVVWIVLDGGKEAMRFIARLKAVGAEATEVKIDVAGPTSGPFAEVQRRLSENRTIRHMYVRAMKEQVAATLGDRAYNSAVVAPTMVLAVVANLTTLSAQMDGAGPKDRQPNAQRRS